MCSFACNSSGCLPYSYCRHFASDTLCRFFSCNIVLEQTLNWDENNFCKNLLNSITRTISLVNEEQFADDIEVKCNASSHADTFDSFIFENDIGFLYFLTTEGEE